MLELPFKIKRVEVMGAPSALVGIKFSASFISLRVEVKCLVFYIIHPTEHQTLQWKCIRIRELATSLYNALTGLASSREVVQWKRYQEI